MSIRKHTNWLLLPLFLLGCAKQTAPTGGPKDTIPPSLLTSTPRNQQTNYTSNSIELEFNEHLVLNNPKEQLIITPDLDNKFQAQAKRNSVSIKFEKPLQTNTTYSLNFRDAVQDITEKNPAENLKLAFSTGDYIDSLSIKGQVYDLLRSTEVKDATVALYQADTFDIFKHKPIFFTKSDKKGLYHLTNLKPGTYYIYAMEDKNKNLLADSKSESYGFLANKITLSKDTSNIAIPLVRLDARPLKLTSARPTGTYYNIKTSKNVADYNLHAPNSGIQLFSSFAEDQANIRIYRTFPLEDSLLVHFTATDSISNKIDTTLYLKFPTRSITPDKFNIVKSEFRIIAAKGILTGAIAYNKPLLTINYDSIFYRIDSARLINITANDIKIDTTHNILHIHKSFPKNLLIDAAPTTPNQPTTTSLKPNTTSKNNYDHQMYLAKASLISVERDSSNRISTTVKPATVESTGIISTDINSETNYFVQLLSKDNKIIQTAFGQKHAIFEDLEPADYRIRLIIDDNKDGRWNPGNYHQRREPEHALFYKNEKQLSIIPLKANWELGPLLITY